MAKNLADRVAELERLLSEHLAEDRRHSTSDRVARDGHTANPVPAATDPRPALSPGAPFPAARARRVDWGDRARKAREGRGLGNRSSAAREAGIELTALIAIETGYQTALARIFQ